MREQKRQAAAQCRSCQDFKEDVVPATVVGQQPCPIGITASLLLIEILPRALLLSATMLIASGLVVAITQAIRRRVVYDRRIDGRETRVMTSMVGKPAAPFELNDAQGNKHRAEDYRGAWLLLIFHRHLG